MKLKSVLKAYNEQRPKGAKRLNLYDIGVIVIDDIDMNFSEEKRVKRIQNMMSEFENEKYWKLKDRYIFKIAGIFGITVGMLFDQEPIEIDISKVDFDYDIPSECDRIELNKFVVHDLIGREYFINSINEINNNRASIIVDLKKKI